MRVACPPNAPGCRASVDSSINTDHAPTLCYGVGHHTCAGGDMPLNVFGEDLKKAGYKWTRELCEKDSDGDGFTNGEELGDPCCVWAAFDIASDYMASFTPSHPGVTGEK